MASHNKNKYVKAAIVEVMDIVHAKAHYMIGDSDSVIVTATGRSYPDYTSY